MQIMHLVGPIKLRFFLLYTPLPTEWLKVSGINCTLEGDENVYNMSVETNKGKGDKQGEIK
jgi:hypothetical protein